MAILLAPLTLIVAISGASFRRLGDALLHKIRRWMAGNFAHQREIFRAVTKLWVGNLVWNFKAGLAPGSNGPKAAKALRHTVTYQEDRFAGVDSMP